MDLWQEGFNHGYSHALADVQMEVAGLETIVPSDLEPEELFRRNGEYVRLRDLETALDALSRK